MREFELQSLKSIRSVPLICVRITSSSGKESNLRVRLRDTVRVVKDRALGCEYSKETPFYKLALANTNRELEDEKTLEEENIEDNDELILFRRRRNPSSQNEKKESKHGSNQKAPDLKSIKKLTAKLVAEKVNESSTNLSPLPFDFNTELRRILIALIDSSILLQSVNEDQEGDSAAQEDAVQPDIDPAIVKQLTDMGFQETRAKKALMLNRLSPMMAMEWLFQHENDADIDEPLNLGPKASKTRRKRREFAPNPRAVNNLKEMGFQEDDILMALRATGNNQEAACEWLLGDRQGGIEDINQGLDPSSPLYQAIMENPLVQLSLNNPRVLGAFEDMLETPATSSFYISDPETGPVLLQVSRIVQGFART